MISKTLVVAGVAAMMAYGTMPGRGEVVTATGEKIALTVLYVGHAGSSREKDFLGFLENHFAKVGKADLAAFKEEQAKDSDLVILDYDGDGFNSPRPKLSDGYCRATVTVGVTGARIGDELRLKTGYM